MRIIKFRGKSLETDDWVYGFLAHGNLICTWDNRRNAHEVLSITVGQFTGLTDKNGKEIYEGDIIRHKDMVKPYHVIYDGHQFTPNDGFRSLSYPKHWEVVGNIHDNPELLKGGAR